MKVLREREKERKEREIEGEGEGSGRILGLGLGLGWPVGFKPDSVLDLGQAQALNFKLFLDLSPVRSLKK